MLFLPNIRTGARRHITSTTTCRADFAHSAGTCADRTPLFGCPTYNCSCGKLKSLGKCRTTHSTSSESTSLRPCSEATHSPTSFLCDVQAHELFRHTHTHTHTHANTQTQTRTLHEIPPSPYRYVPPTVPLWTHHTGVSQRTRRETHLVLIEILTSGYAAELIMLILALLPLYRFPSLVRNIRAHWWNRRRIIANTLIEYIKDVAAVVCATLVVCCL